MVRVIKVVKKLKDSTLYKRMDINDVPPFWLKVRKYAMYGALITSGLTAFLTRIEASVIIIALVGALDAMCLTAIGLATLTTKNSKLSDK